jgi:hypothetical protein
LWWSILEVALRVLLISVYDLGHQPFGLASPAAWLRADGHEVEVADLSRDRLRPGAIAAADWVAFHLPMHTATRMALPVIDMAREVNPSATLVCYGLYAPMNGELLRARGVSHVIGGEFEQALAGLVSGRATRSLPVVLDRLPFRTPDRTGLPGLIRYAALLHNGARKAAGYTEASRGCKHLCRHCPIVPVYEGRFRIIPRDIVMADIRQQVEAGAEHITFGDPDFLNGPGHALPLVEAVHAEFPALTYDATIKVEHLLQHPEAIAVLARTGCLFVTSAVESLDDAVLERLAKGHTRADFVAALALVRAAGLTMLPTFVTFTPWTTWNAYLDLLRTVRDLDLVENVAPIQLAIRLLIPAGSKLLELPDLGPVEWDAGALQYRWKHPDAAMDVLGSDLQRIVRTGDQRKTSRQEIFGQIWQRAFGTPPDFHLAARATVPYLNEPWYC